jgi:hypothetical protein
MGTPREYFLGENDTAIGLIRDNLRTREPHLDDLDMAQSIISQLHDAGLIVVKRDLWERAAALVAAVAAVR